MRLLLAEDERELSRALVAILEHAGYVVDAAYDGAQALDDVSANDYDAIVLDIMMPKVDGLTVLRRLREGRNDVPVLMLTAKSEIRDRVEGLDSGANDYLTKPFAAAELLARIRALTRANPSEAVASPGFGDLELDVEGRRVRCGGRSCDLTQREFQMMEVLLRSPATKVSVDQFMRKVWGGLSDAEPSIVWVYISGLRKKLAGIGSRVRIVATRGVGYCLEFDGAHDADAPAGAAPSDAPGGAR